MFAIQIATDMTTKSNPLSSRPGVSKACCFVPRLSSDALPSPQGIHDGILLSLRPQLCNIFFHRVLPDFRILECPSYLQYPLLETTLAPSYSYGLRRAISYRGCSPVVSPWAAVTLLSSHLSRLKFWPCPCRTCLFSVACRALILLVS